MDSSKPIKMDLSIKSMLHTNLEKNEIYQQKYLTYKKKYYRLKEELDKKYPPPVF